MHHADTKEKLSQLLSNIDQLNNDALFLELSRIAESATGRPGWEALAAQNQALRTELEYFIRRVQEGSIKSKSTFSRYQEALIKNPAVSLADVRADAIIEAKEATLESFTDGGARWLCRASDLEQYAEKLRKVVTKCS